MPDNPEKIPLNEEHIEAAQSELDKRRYEERDKLSDEDKAKFQEMEDCVVKLIGLKCPFFLLVAPESTGRFWKYQKFTNDPHPLSEEESNLVDSRIYTLFLIHARFFADVLGHKITLTDFKGNPYLQITDKGITNLGEDV